MTPSPTLRLRMALLALALATPAAAAPPPVQLQVSTQVLAAVNPQVLNSFNFGNWMQVAEFRKQWRGLQPRMLRFPGGNPADQSDMDEDMLKVFKVNVDLLGGPDVYFQTRVFQARPGEPPARNGAEDAAALVRLVRQQGLNVRYWEIGNEPDLYAVTRGDANWTPERYCTVFRAQAQAIKRADPRARVAGPAVSAMAPGRDQFLRGFVRECGDVVDVLTYHLYPTDGTGDEAQALETADDADETITRYRDLWADPQRNPKGFRRKIKFGVSEYGLSSNSQNARHLADFPAAMWAAEVALRLNQQGVDLAHYFAFQGTAHHGLIDRAGVPRPTYYAYRILSTLKDGWLVAARSNDPGLWVHATQNGELLTVLLINRTRSAKTVSTELPKQRFMGGEYFDEKMVDEERATGRFRSGADSVEVPGYSFVRLNFRPPPK
ncbi:MAG TPA: hypothetical protein VFL86_09715 [Burkholderiaceae bacterium]|nr:hypothetical protein [Burkholderiaceae bacterium]